MKQLVRNDRVKHAHATFVENAHDRFALLKLAGDPPPKLLLGCREFDQVQILHVALIMAEAAAVEPLAQAALEIGIGEALAPNCAVLNPRFGQRPVEVQHSRQARPRPAPICEGENWAAVSAQTGKDVMAVLPHAFSDDQWRVWIEPAKYFNAQLLRINKAVLLGWIIAVGSHHSPTLGLEGLCEEGLHPGLLGPTALVGAQPQVPIGHEINLLRFERTSCFHARCRAEVRSISWEQDSNLLNAVCL